MDLLSDIAESTGHRECLLNDRHGLLLAAGTIQETGSLEEGFGAALIVACGVVENFGLGEGLERGFQFPSPALDVAEAELGGGISGTKLNGPLIRGSGCFGVFPLLRQPARFEHGGGLLLGGGFAFELQEQWLRAVVIPGYHKLQGTEAGAVPAGKTYFLGGRHGAQHRFLGAFGIIQLIVSPREAGVRESEFRVGHDGLFQGFARRFERHGVQRILTLCVPFEGRGIWLVRAMRSHPESGHDCEKDRRGGTGADPFTARPIGIASPPGAFPEPIGKVAGGSESTGGFPFQAAGNGRIPA